MRFDGKTNRPHSNNVQRENSKLSCRGPHAKQQKLKEPELQINLRGSKITSTTSNLILHFRDPGKARRYSREQAEECERLLDKCESGFNDPEPMQRANSPILVGTVP